MNAMRKLHMLLPSRNISTHLSTRSAVSFESTSDFRGWHDLWMCTIEVSCELGGDELAVAFTAVDHDCGYVGVVGYACWWFDGGEEPRGEAVW